GGATHAANLKCLCRQHHLVKTFWGWREKQLPDGTLIWTSPAGQTYVSTPGSALLFPSLCHAVGGMPAPDTDLPPDHSGARSARRALPAPTPTPPPPEERPPRPPPRPPPHPARRPPPKPGPRPPRGRPAALLDGEQPPLPRHTLELINTALHKLEPGPDHQIAQRAGHQHLVGPRHRANARADVHGDPADVIAADLALAGVQPGAHGDAQRGHRVADCHRAADRALRTVEHRQKAVARRIHLPAPKPSQLRPHDGVVRIKQRTPIAVTHRGGRARRVHDVGKEQG